MDPTADNYPCAFANVDLTGTPLSLVRGEEREGGREGGRVCGCGTSHSLSTYPAFL